MMEMDGSWRMIVPMRKKVELPVEPTAWGLSRSGGTQFPRAWRAEKCRSLCQKLQRKENQLLRGGQNPGLGGILGEMGLFPVNSQLWLILVKKQEGSPMGIRKNSMIPIYFEYEFVCSRPFKFEDLYLWLEIINLKHVKYPCYPLCLKIWGLVLFGNFWFRC